MSDIKNQWISELMDDAVSDKHIKEAVNELTSDVNNLNRWQRYHLIRETIQGGLPKTLDIDLTDTIMANIAKEEQKTGISKSPVMAWLQPTFNMAFMVIFVVAIVLVYKFVHHENNQSLIVSEAATTTLPQNNIITTTSPNTDINYYLLSHAEYAATPNMPRMLPYARLSNLNTDVP